jgi:hypothetical protein
MQLLGQHQTRYDKREERAYHTPICNTRRFSHAWVIGKTRVGKSTALERWAIDDIHEANGVVFFDPHGTSADTILTHIPRQRRNDTILFDPSDKDYPIGFNILAGVPNDRKPFVASSIVDTFKAVWGYSKLTTPDLDQFLYNGIAALLDVPDATLVGLKYLLTSSSYRQHVLKYVKDPAIKDFWQTDFETLMPEKERRQRTLSTLNKIGALISDPTIRNVIGQTKTTFDLQDILDNGKILIVRLPQGQLGIQKASLIGALLLSQLHLTALGRSVRPVHVYIDECHHFGTNTLIEMLSGIGKFQISLTLAHQYLHQLSPDLREALIGTVGTMLAFRIGVTDAERLAPELGTQEASQLPPFQAYARTETDTYHLHMPQVSAREYPSAPRKIRDNCRNRHAMPRRKIERLIEHFIASIAGT